MYVSARQQLQCHVCHPPRAVDVSEGADCRILAHWDDRGSGGNTKSVRWEAR